MTTTRLTSRVLAGAHKRGRLVHPRLAENCPWRATAGAGLVPGQLRARPRDSLYGSPRPDRIVVVGSGLWPVGSRRAQ